MCVFMQPMGCVFCGICGCRPWPDVYILQIAVCGSLGYNSHMKMFHDLAVILVFIVIPGVVSVGAVWICVRALRLLTARFIANPLLSRVVRVVGFLLFAWLGLILFTLLMFRLNEEWERMRREIRQRPNVGRSLTQPRYAGIRRR